MFVTAKSHIPIFGKSPFSFVENTFTTIYEVGGMINSIVKLKLEI